MPLIQWNKEALRAENITWIGEITPASGWDKDHGFSHFYKVKVFTETYSERFKTIMEAMASRAKLLADLEKVGQYVPPEKLAALPAPGLACPASASNLPPELAEKLREHASALKSDPSAPPDAGLINLLLPFLAAEAITSLGDTAIHHGHVTGQESGTGSLLGGGTSEGSSLHGTEAHHGGHEMGGGQQGYDGGGLGGGLDSGSTSVDPGQ